MCLNKSLSIVQALGCNIIRPMLILIRSENKFCMKKTRRLFIPLLAALTLLLMSGCVTLQEEITVQEDGSGTLLFALGVESESYEQFQESIPEGLELESLLALLIQDENVTVRARDTYEADGRTWERIELEVGDFIEVFSDEKRIGPLLISLDEDEGVYYFIQMIDISLMTIGIPGMNLLDLSAVDYNVSLSSPQIIDTNGVQRTADESTWEVSLIDILQAGEVVYLEAQYALEPYEGVFIPWELFYPYVVIGFLALGALSILIVIIVNTTTKREKPQQYKF